MLQEGGTYVIPGHGRISDEHDVVMYRDMLVIVRDRIRDMVAKKMTLEQVKAARPTLDYDGRYGADTGPVDDGDVRRGDLQGSVGGAQAGAADQERDVAMRPVARARRGSSAAAACAIVVVAVAVVRDRAGAGRRAAQAAGRGAARRRLRARRAQRGAVDLTGTWVSIVTEDWRWRMVTPPKGDAASIPSTPKAARPPQAWDLEADNNGRQSVQGVRRRRHHAPARAACASRGRTTTR